MNEFDLLLTFMNIAVAFAGFTGVITLIDRSAARVSPDVVSFRVRYLVFAVILVMVLSALPFILVTYGVRAEVAWRIGCGFAALSSALFLTALVTARLRLTGQLQEGFSRLQFNTTLPAGVATVLALGAAALGAIPAPGTYLVGVFYLIISIALLFMRLVFMLDASMRNRNP